MWNRRRSAAVISLGIDYMQGFDIGMPVPIEQLACAADVAKTAGRVTRPF